MTPTPGSTPTTDHDGDGYSASVDCNDNNGAIHPGVSEVCDAVDNNCSGQVDEGVLLTFYLDSDADSYGSNTVTGQGCTPPSGSVGDHSDCDDTDPLINPGSTEDECLLNQDMNCDDVVGISLHSGDDLLVDLPYNSLTITLTLGGKAVSGANTSATDSGAIRLRHVETGETFEVGDTWSGSTGTAVGTFTNQVLPGVYDILYSNQAKGTSWPINQNALLQAGVTINSDKNLSLDIPVVAVNFSTTLGGSALTNTNTNADDYGKIALRDVVSGEKFSLYSTFNTTTAALSSTYAAKLIPGSYDIEFEVGKDGPSWPANDVWTLASAVSLRTAQSYVVNVPTTNLKVTLKLGGKDPSGSNTNDKDYGQIRLYSPTSLTSFKFFNTYDKAQARVVPNFTGGVIPGTYDVYYEVQSAGGNWPINKGTLLKSGVVVNSSTNTTVDINPIKTTINLTLAGKTVNGGNTSDLDYGQIRLRDVGLNDFKVFDSYDTKNAKVVASYVAVVLPGVYDVVYETKEAGGSWPLNEKALLKTSVALTSTQTLAVDIPTVAITCNMTLAGKAVNGTNTNADDYGKVDVYDIAAGDRFKLCGAWNTTSGTVGVPATVKIIPGTYDLRYDNSQDGPHWPGNTNITLKSAQALLTSQSITLDVPVVSFSVGYTLDGTPLNTTNTTAADFGHLELWNLNNTADQFTGYVAWDSISLQVAYTQEVQIIPGSYEFAYSSEKDGPYWPGDVNYGLGCFTVR